MPTRTRLAITVSALAAASALFIATPGALATQGQPVLAGQENTEATTTRLVNTNEIAPSTCSSYSHALAVCGQYGIVGHGNYGGVSGVATSGGIGIGVRGEGPQFGVIGQSGNVGVSGYGTGTGVEGRSQSGTGMYAESLASNGVGIKATALTGGVAKAVWGVAGSGYGGYFDAPGGAGFGVFASGGALGVRAFGPIGVYSSGTTTGVEGEASSGGTGVYGHNSGSAGIGVKGQTGGTGSAVFGEATTNGVGVFGKSQSGTALRGDSPNGIALQVNGKAKFSRSGSVTVAAGTASKTVSLSGVSGSSMVVASAQQNGNVFVKAAVPAAGSFTIFLNGNAPGSGLKVAYFVLN